MMVGATYLLIFCAHLSQPKTLFLLLLARVMLDPIHPNRRGVPRQSPSPRITRHEARRRGSSSRSHGPVPEPRTRAQRAARAVRAGRREARRPAQPSRAVPGGAGSSDRPHPEPSQQRQNDLERFWSLRASATRLSRRSSRSQPLWRSSASPSGRKCCRGLLRAAASAARLFQEARCRWQSFHSHYGPKPSQQQQRRGEALDSSSAKLPTMVFQMKATSF